MRLKICENELGKTGWGDILGTCVGGDLGRDCGRLISLKLCVVV